MIEFLFLLPFAIGGGIAFPKPTYKALVGWWYGAFVPETPALQIANIIDSDQNADAWAYKSGWDYGDYIQLENKKLGVRVRSGKVTRFYMTDKNGKEQFISTSYYEDSRLDTAVNNWNRRRKWIIKFKEREENMTLLTNRITEGYIDSLEMIEQRILKSHPETAPQLRSMIEDQKALPAPEEFVKKTPKRKKTDKELCEKYDPIYGDPAQKSRHDNYHGW